VRDINLWALNLDDSEAVPMKLVDSTQIESSPSFSPDGARMVFVSDRMGDDLWVAASDGSNERRLTRLRGCGSPKWSPDGRSIVFDRLVGPERAIHRILTRIFWPERRGRAF